MNNRKWMIFFIAVLILFTSDAFSETKKLREVGRFSFIDTNMPSQELMKTIVENYTEDVKVGFALAGHSELSVPFLDQVRQSAFTERNLAIGDPMMWMVFRSQGKIKLVQDLEWAGDEPLPVYAFTFAHGSNLYEVVMPKACGNLSLVKVEPITPQAEREGEPVEEPEQEPEYEIRRAKIYDEIYALLSDTDLYCSFRIHRDDDPGMKIIGADREDERFNFSDGDIVYVDQGRADGLESGQLFLVIEIVKRDLVADVDASVFRFGNLAVKKGRARILEMGERKSTAVLEKCCDPVNIGHFLVPFEPQESLMGKDLGYDVPPFKAEGVSGEVVYMQTDYIQLGSGHWALIDMGGMDGIHRGQQLVLYRDLHEGAPLQVFGNLVVVDVQDETSTVKVLSCRDSVRVGDYVMLRPAR